MKTIPPIGGERHPDSWHFARVGEEGPLPNPTGHTFPLLTHDDEGRWELVGTGFYIPDSGLFVTARHVIEHVVQDGKQIVPLVIAHFYSRSGLFGPGQVVLRPISQCWMDDQADIALGVAATATHNVTAAIMENWTWTLDWAVPQNGTPADTYAFPNHDRTSEKMTFAPDAYQGTIIRSSDYRDRVMVPFPYLEVAFRIHGKASGGPILCAGRVVGANCTEFGKTIDQPGPGYGVQIRCLAGAFLNEVIFSDVEGPRRATFDDLVRAGVIDIINYAPPPSSDSPRGSVVRLDAVPTSAPPPQFEFQTYY